MYNVQLGALHTVTEYSTQCRQYEYVHCITWMTLVLCVTWTLHNMHLIITHLAKTYIIQYINCTTYIQCKHKLHTQYSLSIQCVMCTLCHTHTSHKIWYQCNEFTVWCTTIHVQCVLHNMYRRLLDSLLLYTWSQKTNNKTKNMGAERGPSPPCVWRWRGSSFLPPGLRFLRLAHLV